MRTSDSEEILEARNLENVDPKNRRSSILLRKQLLRPEFPKPSQAMTKTQAWQLAFLSVAIITMGLLRDHRAEAACERRSHEMSINDNPGYRPVTLRAYACVETRQHYIVSNVTYTNQDAGFVKTPVQDDCCCVVKNSLLKKKKLRPVRPNLPDAWVTYRRILSCECVPCV
ncbi:uncharacterized protein [Ptychodera flava]|uniref:uncharacterized protein n=1 Tax=Ptychodera flava TaxID=63121 RepID=UPI00396A177B